MLGRGSRAFLHLRSEMQRVQRLPKASQAKLLQKVVSGNHRLHTMSGSRATLKAVHNGSQRRNFTGFFSDNRLRRLEDLANANRADATAELRFIKELNQHYPEAVIRRFESGRYAVSEPIVKEYIKAMAQTGKLETTPIEQLMARVAGRQVPPSSSSYTAGHASTAPAAASGSSTGSSPNVTAALEAEMASMASGGNAPKRTSAGPLWDASAQRAPSASGAMSSVSEKVIGVPESPLVVQMADAGWKTQLWRTIRLLAVVVVIITAFRALMDDRNIGSRLGLGTPIHTAENSDKRFSDVVGMDEAKAELEEVVMYLRSPERFTRLGGKLPKGLLLMGPPGTGKTLLARAIAGEAGVPFFYASGSEFEEMYVGVGARRVRDLFEAAKKRSPCIIFIDEIDAVGGSRQLKDQAAMKMTLNQLLVEMDGFEQNNGVIVIGATNFADSLDDALMRPGRFDRHVAVPLPDVAGRKAILDLYTSKIPIAADVDVGVLARGTPGMSGADLSNLVNQAALKAAVDGFVAVNMGALEYAKDKILMGSERKSAAITKETARMTAYHEGGHALVALLTPGADPIHKATIMPRGEALGMVTQLPEGDQMSMSRKQMLARLDVCMGGRVAEEIIFGEDEITSGASSDLRQATHLAKAMVSQWGFSDEVGLVFHDVDKAGPETKKIIDDEVRRIVTESYERAKKLLTSRKRDLDRLAKALIEFETLSGSEVGDLIKKGKKPAPRPIPQRVENPPSPPVKKPARGRVNPNHTSARSES